MLTASNENQNILTDNELDPDKLTDDQKDMLVRAQRNYGVSLSHGLVERFQIALAEWAAERNAAGEPIPAIASFYAMAAAAGMTVSLLSLQVRANGGFDDDAILRWYAEVGNMAYQLIGKFMDPEVRERSLRIAGAATPEVLAQLRTDPERVQDNADCAKLEKEQREHMNRIMQGIRSGKLVGTVGHA
jgi:hypothetical protein